MMKLRIRVFVLSVALCSGAAGQMSAFGQDPNGPTLEQRQPLELVFADSIVPQDRHETMSTTGVWYSRQTGKYDGSLTQKIEWGVSDKLQVSVLAHPLRVSNVKVPATVGIGDFEIGARYTWANAGSPFTHVALALDADLPSGNPRTGTGEGAYRLSPSVLLAREFGHQHHQVFSTVGAEFAVAHRGLDAPDEIPRHEFFANSGVSFRFRPGWTVLEFSISTDRWSGGNETRSMLTPSYVWRARGRTELLLGVPIGLTSSSSRIGAVIKFTFERGGS